MVKKTSTVGRQMVERRQLKNDFNDDFRVERITLGGEVLSLVEQECRYAQDDGTSLLHKWGTDASKLWARAAASGQRR